MTSSMDVPGELQGELAKFQTVTTLPVQWGDQDAFGHVNNVVYFRWYETARIDFMNAVSEGTGIDMRAGGIGPILASINCSYKRQLRYPDTILIGTRTGKIGKSSVEIEHSLFSRNECELIAQATSIIVIFDYDARRPLSVCRKHANADGVTSDWRAIVGRFYRPHDCQLSGRQLSCNKSSGDHSTTASL